MAFLIIGENFNSSEIFILLWGVLGCCRFVDFVGVVGLFTGTLVGFKTWLCGGL